jgi:ParB family chromosome partitioning protein
LPKKGLGKGLSALISSSLSEEDARSLAEVPIGEINANPFQPRRTFDKESLSTLAESIREHGILQPVILKRTGAETYELVAGERRVRAAEIVGLATVPAVIRTYDDRKMLEIALIENLQREDINALDAARAYNSLRKDYGLTQNEVAQRVGKAQSTIANALRLLSLPKKVLVSLENSDITEGHARAVLQAPVKAQLKLWEEAKLKGLSVRETEKLARKAKKTSKSKDSEATGIDGHDPNLLALEDKLQTALGTKVKLRWNGKTGRIEIEFYSEEHLESVVERLIGGN